MVDLDQQITQQQFGDLVGISQQAVSDLLRRDVIQQGKTAGEWLHSYCSHLREQAAGRATAGDLDLAQERARLAREQADKVAMQNAVSRRELASVTLLEQVLATVGRQIAAILEAIPVNIKRRSKNLTAEDIEIIVAEITRARNIAAAVQLDLKDQNESDGDTESDPPGFEEP